jgi:hypothetical protein
LSSGRSRPYSAHNPPRSSGANELAEEQLEHLVGDPVLDLETNRRSGALPERQDALHGFQEIARLVFLDCELGVAGDPEAVPVFDALPVEQPAEVGRDHLFQRDEVLAVFEHDEAGQDRRHLDPGEADVVLCTLEHDGEVEGQVRDVGKRVGRIDR